MYKYNVYFEGNPIPETIFADNLIEANNVARFYYTDVETVTFATFQF